jgi:outer membrane protein
MNKIFLFLLLANALNAQNQSVNPELAALIQKTIVNYPRLREMDIANQIASERIGIQQAAFMPTVVSNATFNYLTPIAQARFGQTDFRFQPHENYNLNVQANGLIFDFGRTKAAISKAMAEYEVGKANLAAMNQNIAFQVAQLYYGIVYTQKSIAVQIEQQKSLAANEQLLGTKQRNGDALELDVLNAQVAIANAENRIIDLTAQLEKQKAILTSLTGERNEITANTFDYQVVSSDASISKNLDFEISNAKIKAAEADILYNKKFLRPAITYNGGLGFRNGYQPNIDNFRFNWGLGAGISYPLYVGGRDRKVLKISELTLMSARTSAAATERSANLEIEQAQADHRAANAKLKTAQTITEHAKSALAIAKTRFQNGIATNVEVLSAETNLEQATLTTITAQYQLCLANLSLEKVVGKLF